MASRRAPRAAKSVAPRVLNPDSGGVDIGATQILAAVPPDRTDQPVREFTTFTVDLYALAAWFRAHGVTTVAMESTSVYWIPVFQVLESCGLQVCLVNARHVQNVPGRKTDVQDCQWLQYLHSVGLLQASFRPDAEICAVRAIMRQRANLVQEGARQIQYLQKALDQMNLHLHHVLSDLSGVTGLAIVDAILAGERDPQVLAQQRQPGVKATEETLIKALTGDYRDEHLFTLRQARKTYTFLREQMAECDAEIDRRLRALATVIDPEETPPPPPSGGGGKPRKGALTLPYEDLRTELYRVLGTDLTQVPGLDVSNVTALLSEVGPDLSRFPTANHFVSWLALCPNPQKSGGKVLKKGTRKAKHRVATIFRVAAQALWRSTSELGDYFRRMKAKLDTAGAIVATAHKLARIFYHLVTQRCAYEASVFAESEAQHQERRVARLRREAARLGLQLLPETPAA